jgi:AcrR family transcriptional regulator
MPPPSYRDYRLPRGNHGLSREQVAENQRWRLIGAASEVLAEVRLIGITSRLICRRAGVSNHTFYAHFENVDDVLAAAFANAAQLLLELTGAARSAPEGSDDACRRALSSTMSLGSQEPGLVALMRVEVAVAIPAVGAERQRLIARLDALRERRSDDARGGIWMAGALGIAVDRLGEGAEGTAATLPKELATLLK